MSFAITAFTILILGAGSSFLLTGGLRRYLIRRAIFDHPNDRSSHATPTPRGGGAAVVAVVGAVWAFLQLDPSIAPPTGSWVVLAGAVGLAAMSWIDDLKNLPASIRLFGHGLAAAAGLWTFSGPIVDVGLPIWLDHSVCFFLWVWFVNLFNFMDGIDGITGVETLTIAGGLVLVGGFAGLIPGSLGGLGLLSVAIIGAMIGFLFWNWHPARIFPGDAGSVPLGFVLAWLLFHFAANGLGLAALCLALYYLTDATWTLARRAGRGEKVWKAHREHAYQKATRSGLSHDQVSGVVFAANLVLILSAVIVVQGARQTGLTLAGVAVLGLMTYLSSGKRPS